MCPFYFSNTGRGKRILEREEAFPPICLGDPESKSAMQAEGNLICFANDFIHHATEMTTGKKVGGLGDFCLRHSMMEE